MRKSLRRGVAVALVAGCWTGCSAAPEGPAPTPDAAPHHVSRHRRAPGLEERVANLAKALELDATQQTTLRQLLESQRVQLRRVWDPGSVPPDERVAATRAILDRTADRIRAILNDEQRKKYLQPRQPRPMSQRSVEAWMNAMQAPRAAGTPELAPPPAAPQDPTPSPQPPHGL